MGSGLASSYRSLRRTKIMRQDNMFWVLIVPGLLSCLCFAIEMGSNFSESWNRRFDDFRRGFEAIGRCAGKFW
jgi:hypothetical protein